MIPVVILAAGRSARMQGADKLLEPVGNAPLLRLQAQRAIGLGGAVLVATGPDHVSRRAVLDGLGVRHLIVPEAVEGMSGTLRGAVAQLEPAPAFMIMLADLVELTTADLQQVYDAYCDKADHLIWRGATVDGKPGHPIIFSDRLRPEFALLKGDKGAESIVRSHAAQTCLVPLAGNRARADLDTPADWAAWRAANR